MISTINLSGGRLLKTLSDNHKLARLTGMSDEKDWLEEAVDRMPDGLFRRWMLRGTKTEQERQREKDETSSRDSPRIDPTTSTGSR